MDSPKAKLLKSAIKSLLTSALPWVLLGVLVIETSLSHSLGSKMFNHEVDKLLWDLKTRTFNAPVVLLGNSVALNVFGVAEKDSRFAVLASNAAIETPGQYYILQRYLKNNNRPAAVVFMAHSPFSGNLEKPTMENYIQRCFTRWNEIAELGVAKLDPAFTTRMMLYKALFSYKFRLRIQEALCGQSNVPAYFGVDRKKVDAGPPDNHGLIHLASKGLANLKDDTISETYLKRLLADCDARNLPFYYIHAPMPASEAHSEPGTPLAKRFAKLRDMEARHPQAHFLEDYFFSYPNNMFRDGTHFHRKHRKAVFNAYLPLLTALADGKSFSDLPPAMQ